MAGARPGALVPRMKKCDVTEGGGMLPGSAIHSDP